MRKVIAVVVVCSGVAAAGPKPQALSVVDQNTTVKAGRVTAQVFHVVAPTPILTANLNLGIAETAGLIGSAQPGNVLDIGCSPGIITNVFASWTCSGMQSNSDGTAKYYMASNAFVDGDDLKQAGVAQVFGKDFAKRAGSLAGKTASDSACTADPKWSIAIDSDAVTFYEGEDICAVGWDVLLPLLPKDSVLRQVVGDAAQNVDAADANPKAGWAKARPRFAAEGGGVVDRLSGLTWAATDSGADIDQAGAAKFATTYRAGGFADWRLPTEEELEELSETAAAHREKADCTKGKSSLLVTPLIKLSCGLAWSSTRSGNGFVGFGFISGTPRVSKPTEKKNYRALVVRDPSSKPRL